MKARLYKPALAVLAAVLFCGVSQMQNRLNVDRKQFGFTAMTPLENAPPILAFTTVALGGFRGLISNVLWIRLNELQDQERYFEMVQLADWITKLEPRFAAVWTHLAWNMAYNISVKCSNFEERWLWVKRGLDLLHQGLKYNPGEVDIYKELSWFFRHKIGQNLDDAHLLYKLRWAQEMQDILGGHPDFPALLNPKTPAERETARKLRDDYHMDPAFIEELDKIYGPLDWRLPDAHALYWAEMGVRNGTRLEKDLIRRQGYSIMQQSCLRGGALPPWVKNVTADNFILWPNLDLIPNVNAAYERTKLDFPDKPQIILTPQKNFLKEAVVLAYEYNRIKDANHWFNYLKQNFTNALTPAEASLGASEWALDQIEADINDTDQNKAGRLVLGLLSQEYLCVIADQDDDADKFDRDAHAVWSHYQKLIPHGADGQIDQNGRRIQLPTFEKLKVFELEDILTRISPASSNILTGRLKYHPVTTPPATNSPPAVGA
jgi:hypothetical protein